MKHALYVIPSIILLLGTCPSEGEIELSDKAGETLTCEILEGSPAGFRLSSARGQITVKPSDLDPGSLEEAIAYAEKRGVYNAFPKVDVEVIVGKKRKREGSTTNMTVTSSFTIQGSRMVPMPAGNASILIFTERGMGSRDVVELKGKFNQPIPAVDSGDERDFQFPDVTFPHKYYSSYTSGRTEYKSFGDLDDYAFYIFILRDRKSERLVHWETSNELLRNFIGKHSDELDTILANVEGFRNSGQSQFGGPSTPSIQSRFPEPSEYEDVLLRKKRSPMPGLGTRKFPPNR